MNNILNSNILTADTPIYRIMPEEYIISLFKDRENVLVKPRKWDDPFENFMLNSKARLASGETGTYVFKDDIYGQCWTLNKASDAMWRIYSQNSDGVRVKTTIGKLLNSLYNHLGKDAKSFGFVGRVQYLSRTKLLSFGNTIFKDRLSEVKIAKTLLVKRPAFKHEKEVRLIHISIKNKPVEDLYRYPVNPHDLVDQLMLDPRLPKTVAENKKKQLAKDTRYKGEIKRSLLYAPPKNLVFPLG